MRNKLALAVSSSGNAYFWGSYSLREEDETNTTAKNLTFLQSEPRQFSTLKNIKISSICCNNMVAFFLSEDGVLYSYGNDLGNSFGILGLGEVYHQSSPTPVRSLFDQRIKQISIGYSHAAALNTIGYLFTWGTGKCGQLGLYKKEKTSIPTLVESAKVFSGKQVVSSYNATVLLTGILNSYLNIRRRVRLYLWNFKWN